MRRLLAIIPVLLLAVAALAAELHVKVTDPHGAVVQHARVALYRAQSNSATDVKPTTAEGIASFDVAEGSYRVQVFAVGFAVQSVSATVPRPEGLVVTVRPAAAPETVEVSATRTPLPTDASATSVGQLNADQLKTMQPTTAADALRFMPGAVIETAGRRGGLASLFVRGGDSRYNKVLIDDVAVTDPGGTFDFGVVPMDEVDRVEMVRGAASTLYGSDAMTSAVQFFTRTGSTPTPELRFGAEGGTFATARGYASVSGARGPIDYNLFGQQFNTDGQGVNDAYSNSSQGANVGLRLSSRAAFRLHVRHSNERSGVQSFWNFNGQPLLPPDTDQRARQNNLLASASITIAAPSKWQHRFTGFEYHHRRLNVDTFQDPGRVSPTFGSIDFPFTDFANINRAGFEYQGEYWATDWTRSTFGYRFEDENGFAGDLTLPPLSHGLRRNHEVYGEQVFTWKRFTAVVGARFVHNESFGNRGVPRIATSFMVLRGGHIFSGTRLRFAYGTGIKEPRLEESFGTGGFGIIPNPNLKAESNRSLEAGVQQSLFTDKVWFSATYFNNLFTNQIEFASDPVTFIGQYVNVNKAFAHGAEIEWHAQPTSRVRLQTTYVYTSTQVLQSPLCEPFCDPLLAAGAPFLRRPKHSANTLLSYTRTRFGAQLGGTFIGPRPDSDFLGLLPPVTHAAGYARVDVGAWHAINSRMTAYLDVENLLNRHYEEVAGYPGLRLNFRAGMRFRLGGE